MTSCHPICSPTTRPSGRFSTAIPSSQPLAVSSRAILLACDRGVLPAPPPTPTPTVPPEGLPTLRLACAQHRLDCPQHNGIACGCDPIARGGGVPSSGDAELFGLKTSSPHKAANPVEMDAAPASTSDEPLPKKRQQGSSSQSIEQPQPQQQGLQPRDLGFSKRRKLSGPQHCEGTIGMGRHASLAGP